MNATRLLPVSPRSVIPSVLPRPSSRSQPLPPRLRGALEHLSGLDLRGVRVHARSPLPALVGARAFAYGCDVYLGPGGDDALAHEAWHAVQQMQGRVRATARVNGLPLNDDPALEAEAERMGRRAERLARGAQAPGKRAGRPAVGGYAPVVQRAVTVANVALATAREVRDGLANADNQVNVTAGNTPNLDEAVDDLIRDEWTSPDWASFAREVKRRDFGYRHMMGAHDLKQQEDRAVEVWRANRETQLRKKFTLEEVESVCQVFRKRSPNPVPYASAVQKYGRLPFVHWEVCIDLEQAKDSQNVRDREMYQWVTQAADAAEPKAMNCHEFVLFSGAWTSLYSPEYCWWALQPVLTLDRSFSDASGSKAVATYVKRIIDAPAYHAHARQDSALKKIGAADRYPALPPHVPAGMVIIANSGAHVAISTGMRRQPAEKGARAMWGEWGHETVELDGWTSWARFGTVEDMLVQHNDEVHMGWMPDHPQQETVELRRSNGQLLYGTDVPATDFYA